MSNSITSELLTGIVLGVPFLAVAVIFLITRLADALDDREDKRLAEDLGDEEDHLEQVRRRLRAERRHAAQAQPSALAEDDFQPPDVV